MGQTVVYWQQEEGMLKIITGLVNIIFVVCVSGIIIEFFSCTGH